MKKSLSHKIKAILLLILVSVMPLTHALPTETEYMGTIAATGYVDDNHWGAFPIGFSFDFFGNTYTDFYVTSNGMVMFGEGSNQYRNDILPWAPGADNYIAPFWDDLVIHATGDIMYQTIGTAPNRKLVVQFNNMSFWNSPVLLGTFQVIIYEDSNNIQTQYRSIVDLTSTRASGGSATVGLENLDGSAGVSCSYNTAGYIQSEKAILFTPGGGSYTFDDNAVYEGVFLQGTVPRASTPTLVSPAYNSTVSDTLSFQWEAAANASSYFVVISQNSDLSSPIHTSADLTDLFYDFILSPDQTYYWSAYSKNSVGTVSWSEIWKFQTSSTPPLVAIPQTMYLEQGEMRTATLLFTGGDAGSKTATITSLPAEGDLYQYDGGVPGPQITTVPSDVSDGSFKVIYSAGGNTGNGAGHFNFQFSDATWTSAEEVYSINVSPPGVPNFLYASKETDRVEITFDRNMTDPTGKHLEFSIQDNGVDVSSSSCMLKPGDPATIIVYVSPNLDTDHSITVAYTKGTVTAESTGVLESFDFQLAGKFVQVINFSLLADKTYGDADYTLSATSSSGLPVTFSSSNSTVVSVSGSDASINGAGESLIYASQAGDATYAAVTFERHQLVNKAVASITLSNLSQEYTGLGIEVTAETLPADLNLKITYDGFVVLPVDIGSYAVSAKVEEANYDGDASDVLIITDLTAPVPDLPVLPDLPGECSATPLAPMATDFYSGAITGTTTTPFPITAQGTTVIIWSYDDGNGNISTQNQNVILNDITAPVAPTLSDVSGECSATASAPTSTDACAGTITATTSDPLSYTTQGTHVISWNFDDGNGNNINVNQNVHVLDVTPPATPVLSDVTGECSATATAPTTTDLCAGTITGTTSDPLSYTTQGSHVITWNFDDGNGNSINVNQNVHILDVTPPVTPILADVSGECSATAPVPTTTDACEGTITGTTSDPLSYTTQGTHAITWNFDDGNGNSINVNQNVVILDITPPVAPTLADVTGECSATALVPTTTDACSGTINGTTSDPLSYATQGMHVITWNFDDGNGNSINVNQNVLIKDITIPETPVLTDLSGECSVTAIAPETSDACAGTITATTSDPLTYSSLGSHMIRWNFDDGNGNSINVSQNVLVTDITAPEIPVLEDLSDECSLSAIAPLTTDVCAGTITGTTSDPLEYSEQGTYVINWT
ncbi:MAG: MBG domain-containing protein, partial [Bacteroides sp.]|nr:MBG domain-containing protein [Bacteroides sp.]